MVQLFVTDSTDEDAAENGSEELSSNEDQG